ncbi:MAG: DUF1642 domain-containing protein [Alkalibacterium sp.]|nr:DUF1642 domain-containing protein [Alkalibacterium sp.]
MDKRELKKEFSKLITDYRSYGGHDHSYIHKSNFDKIFDLIDQLDEPENYSEIALERGQKLLEVQVQRDKAEEELNELKNKQLEKISRKKVISRLKELPEDSRNSWINNIFSEFGDDFGQAKYSIGYEQGRLDGEMDFRYKNDTEVIVGKPAIPSFVAEWIEKCKERNRTLSQAYSDLNDENLNIIKWLYHGGGRNGKVNLFARAWLDGYTVEEKKYVLPIPCLDKDWKYTFLLRDGEEYDSTSDVNFVKRHGLRYTEKEIKAIHESYMAFAVEVSE